MKEDNQFVALTHELCPICAKKINEAILIHRRFGDLSEIHNKATGFGQPCEECQAGINMGAIMIIVVDIAKSGKEFEDLYRCGIIHGIREEAAKEFLKDDAELLERVLKQRALVLDYHIAKQIGLPVNYPPQ